MVVAVFVASKPLLRTRVRLDRRQDCQDEGDGCAGLERERLGVSQRVQGMSFWAMLADNSTMYDSPTTMWLKKPSAR